MGDCPCPACLLDRTPLTRAQYKQKSHALHEIEFAFREQLRRGEPLIWPTEMSCGCLWQLLESGLREKHAGLLQLERCLDTFLVQGRVCLQDAAHALLHSAPFSSWSSGELAVYKRCVQKAWLFSSWAEAKPVAYKWHYGMEAYPGDEGGLDLCKRIRAWDALSAFSPSRLSRQDGDRHIQVRVFCWLLDLPEGWLCGWARDIDARKQELRRRRFEGTVASTFRWASEEGERSKRQRVSS